MSATLTADPPESLSKLAPQLEESWVRSVDTVRVLTMKVPRRSRRLYARTLAFDSASPARWSHAMRMNACRYFDITPVLNKQGARAVLDRWSITVDGDDSPENATVDALGEDDGDELEGGAYTSPDPIDALFDETPESALAPIFVEPTHDPHFHVTQSQKNLLRTVERIARRRSTNVCFTGPTGTGKTSMAEWFAWKTRRPLFIAEVATYREPKDAFGSKELRANEHGLVETRWQKSGLIQALETPRAVVLLDEINRAHPSIHNGLLGLLDHRKRVFLEDVGETVEVAEGVVFMFTMNRGSQYSGTWSLDAALENRIDFRMDIGYLPEKVECAVLSAKTGVAGAVAQTFVSIANLVRARLDDPKAPLPHAISTRQLLRACEGVQAGLTSVEALEFTIVPTFSAEGGTDSDRAHVLQIIQGKIAA